MKGRLDPLWDEQCPDASGMRLRCELNFTGSALSDRFSWQENCFHVQLEELKALIQHGARALFFVI